MLVPIPLGTPRQEAAGNGIGQDRHRAPALTELVRPLGTTWVRALLDRGLILPVFDGLDEIPAAVRGQAIV